VKFVFYNQCELCADTITDILKSERIPYKLESKQENVFSQILYDITIDTSYEYWIFIQKIAVDKLTPYMRAEKSFALPSYRPKVKTLNVEPHTPVILLDKLQKENNFEWEIVVKKPKKSFLKKIIDFLIKLDEKRNG
jgi:hypothetical protein